MELPKIGVTYTQERLGIAAIQSYAANRKQVWRETGTGDVGIDGQLEFVDANGFAVGRTMAVQVKAGTSYFQHEVSEGWKFYPAEKHRNYWEGFSLPVLIVLHDTDAQRSYWTDARQALRTPSREDRAFITVPRANVLEHTDPIVLFENAGVQDQAFISDIASVMHCLLSIRSAELSFPLSYFDLFVGGLTNVCRSIYYGTDVISNAVEYNLRSTGSELGMGMGSQEHEFAFGFVKYLIAQNLAQIDYADCLIDWIDRQMHPHFVAPLTSRGRALVDLIHREEDHLVSTGKLMDGSGRRVAQEGFFEMVPRSYFYRLPRIKDFQTALNSPVGTG